MATDDVSLNCAAARFRYRCVLMERVHSLSAESYNPHLGWLSSNISGLVVTTCVGFALRCFPKRTSSMPENAILFGLLAGGPFLELAGISSARDAHLGSRRRYADLREELERSLEFPQAERERCLLRLAKEKSLAGSESVFTTVNAPSTNAMWALAKMDPEVERLVRLFCF